jgi:hypothetical protein
MSESEFLHRTEDYSEFTIWHHANGQYWAYWRTTKFNHPVGQFAGEASTIETLKLLLDTMIFTWLPETGLHLDKPDLVKLFQTLENAELAIEGEFGSAREVTETIEMLHKRLRGDKS